jgi:DNA-binding phage protein
MKKSDILRIIREEVEVVLTNEEAVEVFDLDPAALLDEMMNEEDDKWIQKAVPADDPDRGKFSAAAKRAGMSTCDYAKKIKNDPNASELQKDRAQFALNTGCKDK